MNPGAEILYGDPATRLHLTTPLLNARVSLNSSHSRSHILGEEHAHFQEDFSCAVFFSSGTGRGLLRAGHASFHISLCLHGKKRSRGRKVTHLDPRRPLRQFSGSENPLSYRRPAFETNSRIEVWQ